MDNLKLNNMTNERLTDDEFYSDEDIENMLYESCPKCGRTYDEIDFDYQICSKCGWDVEEKRFDDDNCREPDENDILNGDADFLTGWI